MQIKSSKKIKLVLFHQGKEKGLSSKYQLNFSNCCHFAIQSLEIRNIYDLGQTLKIYYKKGGFDDILGNSHFNLG